MKRDAFEAIILKANKKAGYRHVVPIQVAARCLHAQHRRFVRLVTQHSKDIEKSFINCDEINAYRLACDHILATLKGRTA